MTTSLPLFLIVFAILHLGHAADCGEKDSSNEVALHRSLLCKYDVDNRPVKDHKSGVNVTIRMLLKSISYSSVWSHAETITINTWMNLKWKDEYLTWKPSDYGGLTLTVIHSSKIWTPDFSVYNSQGSVNSKFNYPCLISNEGQVTCIPQLSYAAVCLMDYEDWPYDRQNCTMTFGTWMNTGEQVNFLMGKQPISLLDYHDNKFWKLINASATRHHGMYKCCPNDTYPSLRFYFVIERHVATIVTLLVTPAIVMIMITITSLWLNIASIERIILMLFNIACHFYYFGNLETYIPSNGAVLPNALIYYRDTTILSCIVLLHCILLRNFVVYTRNVPEWAKRVIEIMNTSAGKIVFHEFDPSDRENIVVEDVENLSKNETQDTTNKEWKKLALFLNRTFAIVVILTYVVLVLVYLL